MNGPNPELLSEVNATLRRSAGTRSVGDNELSIRCLSPTHRDEHPSATWNESKGVGQCLSCSATWTTKAAAELLGVQITTTGTGRRQETSWTIRDRSGAPQAIHVRIEGPDGKRFVWKRPDGSNGLDGRAARSLPLYRTERLDSYDTEIPIYVCEGEKAADAAVALGLQAVGTVTGASGCPNSQVLGELGHLSMTDIVLWPDNDDPGRKHMAKIAAKLATNIMVNSVRTVDVSSLWGDQPQEGQDAADLAALPEGGLPLVGEAAEGDACDADPNPASAHQASAVPLAELLARKMPPREWLLHGLIQQRDLGMIHAFRGVGKSRFAHGVGLAVASGGSFLRFHADEPRGVLLVDGELPREDLQRMLAQAIAASDAEPVAPFNVLSADLSGDPLPSLASEKGQEIVERHLDDVALLILDNISTLFNGLGAENESESWEKAQAWLLDLRRRGVAVELLHHDGKGGAQRGTSRREDVLSQVVQLRRPPDYQPSQGAVFEVHFTKARGLVGEAADPFEATLHTDPDGRPVWTWRPVEDALADRVREMKELGLSQREIAKELGVNQSTVSRALRRSRRGDASMRTPRDASVHHWQGEAH